ncbi:MAG: EscU/YscU/HrcU family type III secretion system export apparatus switch protein [Ruegeria sp.]
MSEAGQDDAERSHEPTPQKLRKARQKGDVPRSTDLSVAAAYLGLVIAAAIAGQTSVTKFGSGLMTLLDRPEGFAEQIFEGAALVPMGRVMWGATGSLWVWFMAPAVAVLLAILVQQSFVVAPSRIAPKLSRLSVISNAKQKFGRAGLFEFAKSAVKLALYTTCLGLYLTKRSDLLVGVLFTGPGIAAAQLGRLFLEFMLFVCLIAGILGAIDALWQQAEFRRKNRMTRKEVMDEMKEAEGDPHMKMARRQKAQDIATNQMLSEVPAADVVIVNPTHVSVALKWSRQAGSAPVCVAKGVDEVALTIRRLATESGIPIHEDPPTARALHATVDLGQEIPHSQYAAVAVAIRFAEDMRRRARAAL